MFSLVFMGKESDHIKKQHVHEAPKVMLIPAAILAALCFIWGLSMTGILDFMSKSAITAGLSSLNISLLGSFDVVELDLPGAARSDVSACLLELLQELSRR